jgi:hypothetical protein
MLLSIPPSLLVSRALQHLKGRSSHKHGKPECGRRDEARERSTGPNAGMRLTDDGLDRDPYGAQIGAEQRRNIRWIRARIRRGIMAARRGHYCDCLKRGRFQSTTPRF